MIRNQIYEKLKEMGYGSGGDPGEEERIALWRSWYEGEVPHFHSYRVYNGQKRVLCRRAGLGMAKKVCEDWANLLMNERVRIRAAGEKEQKFLDRVFEENRFFPAANRLQELKAALGTGAYVPRVTGGKLRIDCIDAEHIFPLSWENGVISECAFASGRRSAGRDLVYLQLHRLVSGYYRIENMLFACEGDRLERIALGDVPEFAGLRESVDTWSRERWFVTDRMNIVNNFAPESPMGVSVFANAIDQLRGVDVAYDSYVNEFILGKKRIMLKPEATKDFDGAPLFDADELAFYILPEDSANSSISREIDMKLRAAEHHAGLQDMLNLLGMKCGFGEQHYRFEPSGLKTATEVVSANSSLYRSVRKHELLLEAALKELCAILLRTGWAYFGEELDEETEITVDFDDSIIEDSGSDFERDLKMLDRGVLEKEEFRRKWKT